jgi:MinD-like ATPase involved in chromosome partitioning or flagellar assembly
MEHKRLTLFAGHYGSGKTNIAVNYALCLAKEGKRVCIADLDIVNPYFRTKDSEKELSERGIHLVSPQYANSNVDLPALPAESYRLVQDKSTYGIMDIGGDDRGAYALGRYADSIKKENNYEMFMVINMYRPLTRDVESTVEVMKEIETACSMKFTAIVNNSNIGEETTAQDVLDSLEYAQAVSQATGLPIGLTTVREDLYNYLCEKVDNLMPLRLQEKIC